MSSFSMRFFFLFGSLFLFLALQTSAVNVRQMSIDDYINFVNPPAVHKYQNKFGESILCVKFSDQISVKYASDNFTRGLEKPPKLKSSPLNIPNIDSVHINISELFLNDECPKDTVALREIKREEVERAGSVSKFLNGGRRYGVIPNANPAIDGAEHEYATVRFINVHRPYSTVSAVLNVWRPNVAPDAYFSISQIWLINYNGNKLEIIEVGWTVYPARYGDTKPRLFLHWTSNNYTNGCYDYRCPGYVPFSGLAHPDTVPLPASEPGGLQVETTITVQKEVIENRGVGWVLYFAGTPMGYWPASLFGAHSLGSAIIEMEVGGEVSYIPRPVGSAYTRTGMGSGRFPWSGYLYSAYTKKIQMYGSDGQQINDRRLEFVERNPACYMVHHEDAPNPDWGTTVFFGGPGGDESNPLCVE